MKKSSKLLSGLGTAAIIATGSAAISELTDNSGNEASALSLFQDNNKTKNVCVVNLKDVQGEEQYIITVPGEDLNFSIRDEHKDSSDKGDESDVSNELPNEEEPGTEIGNGAGEEGNETSGTISNYPPAGERTDLSGLRDLVDKLSKALVGLGIGVGAASLGLLIFGIVHAKKSNKGKSINTEESLYFVGEDNKKNLKDYLSVVSEIEKIDEQIEQYEELAENETNSATKSNYIKLAEKIKNEKSYSELKDKEITLLRKLYSALSPEMLSTEKRQELLSEFAKDAQKVVKIPENNDIKLSDSISENIDKFIKIEKKLEKKNQTNTESSLTFINVLKSRKITKTENKLNLKKNEILGQLQNLNLSGLDKVMLDNILNVPENIFTKDGLTNLGELITSLKTSDLKIFKKYMSLLEASASCQVSKLKGNLSESAKFDLEAKKLIAEIKAEDPKYGLKYYGKINSFDKDSNIPINPLRYVYTERTDLKDFFDKVCYVHFAEKDNRLYELNVSYKNPGNKINNFVCSFDNEKSLKIMKAKFLTFIPSDSKDIEIVEKTCSLGKKPVTNRSNINLADGIEEYKKLVGKFEDRFSTIKKPPLTKKEEVQKEKEEIKKGKVELKEAKEALKSKKPLSQKQMFLLMGDGK